MDYRPTIDQPLKTYYYTHMTPQQLQQESIELLQQETPHQDLLIIKTANQWMTEANNRKVPKMLFGKFWYEGEVCILFADSNLGKSILAVQIADAIAKSGSKHPFEVETIPQRVLYCDFELTNKQFESRYSVNYQHHYDFGINFLRAEMNPEMEVPDDFSGFDEYLIWFLERLITQSGIKVLVIDNLTYLRNETEQAKDALPLMKHLKQLKNKYDLSILVLAHTPKRDLTQPITRNDLQGSKMLMNFCDSAFTIGESNADSHIRYLKQIKQRNTEQVYGDGNIILCQIAKPDNFLQYEVIGYSQEWTQLEQNRGKVDQAIVEQITALKQEGLSLREIGKQVGISHQKVDRILKKVQ